MRMILKSGQPSNSMIQRKDLGRILQFVGHHWNDVSADPQNKAMQGLPDDFWMNSLGGKAGNGYWVTALMYTEDRQLAEAFKEVLLRWQSKGANGTAPPDDLIQIGSKRNR